MKKIWKNLSETYKIFVLMLLLILLTQLGTLFYLWQVESQVLLNKERQTLQSQLNIHAKLLEQHLNGLQRRLEFLATLEVMDDIMVNDIDKRIAILLEKKAKELSQNIVLIAKNAKGKTVASSSNAISPQKSLKFQVEIKASFDNHRKIGTITLLYPFKNLAHLKVENPYQTLWLTPPFEEALFKKIDKSDKINVRKVLNRVLQGWELTLSYEKNHALKTLKEIESILLIGFLLSFCMLLYIVFKLSKRQIKLLENTQEVLELKKTFLSTMSHELRTPLGSILALTQHLLMSPKISESNALMLNKIESASEHLLSMINNLLQLSKLESKSMQVNKESVDVKALIKEMIEMLEPLVNEKNLMLNISLLEGRNFIKTDSNLFKQVVMNLFSNAIKFTQEGSITLILTKENNSYLLRIKDTGIGIDKEKQSSIFSEFYQAHGGKEEIKHSSGLGLALSQKVAKLINGKISIESKGLGHGCEVRFRFASF